MKSLARIVRPGTRSTRSEALAVAALALLAACGGDGGSSSTQHPLDDTLRLHQVQVLGSHNSYHRLPRPALFDALAEIIPPLAIAWDYEHLPLPEQFETQGIRQIELDVWADPEGNRFSNRPVLSFIGEDPDSGIPELSEPGFKVLHVHELDFESTCWTFVSCLEDVRDWSLAHPGHVPIFILVEAKDDATPDLLQLGFGTPLPIGPAEFDALDEEIRSVFDDGHVVTPDEVRGDFPTLGAAIEERGWPTLGELRGRVIFALDNGGQKKADYIAGHPSLEGRILFTSSEPPEPEAAFVKLNDPIGDGPKIRDLVQRGFVVRTRTDSDTEQARTGDTTDREAALASGAQFISTDYPVPDPDFGTGYFVEIPGGTPARCNPLTAPAECTSTDVENPALLGGD
jgi:hypothetical protein